MTDEPLPSADLAVDPSPEVAGGVLASGFRLTTAEATSLAAKLQWTVVGWYRASGQFDAAAAVLDAIAERGGASGQLLEERARVALLQGETARAIALLRERVAQGPTASARAGLARAHLEAGDLAEAAAISAELCREQPELATVGNLAADIARAGGDRATARAYWEGVLETKPDSVAAMLALARVALQAADTRQTTEWLDRALAAAGEHATSSQLTTAGAIALLADQPLRAATLRQHAAHLESARAAALARTVAEALRRALPGQAATDTLPPVVAPSSARSERSTPPPSMTSNGNLDPTTETTELDQDALPLAAVAAPEVDVDPRVLEMLQRDFGHDALRPGQAAVIANVLAGRDTLAIMPTGAGKSLTFQLAAMLMEGTTLVLSPLIALMKDQVESLPPAVRERTALLNSSLSPDEQRRVLDELADGAYKLIYVAPERLRQHAFLRALRTAGTRLVVVDEAHCISLWGHDFRPDYLAIPAALPELGDPAVLAITATATPKMADAIAAGFDRDLARVRISIFRPNLFYEAHRVANREEKIAKVVAISRQERGAGIIYVSSRRDAESIAGVLRGRGVNAVPYHAGLDPATRARNQEAFMGGSVRVVVATVAFGMGVDKANVRFLIHLSPPGSLEAYAQESGRAGRDGKPARCVLLTAPTDQARLNQLARRDELDLDALRQVYAGVQRFATGTWAILDPESLTPFAADGDDPDEVVDPRIALGLLDQADLLRRHPDVPVSFTLRSEPDRSTAPSTDDPAWERFIAWSGLGGRAGAGVTIETAEACTALDLTPVALGRLLGARTDVRVREGQRLVCLEVLPVGKDAGARLVAILDRSREEARRRIQQVIAYAAGGTCRHVLLANHLGEALDPCGTVCDVCTGTATTQAAASESTQSSRSRATAADAEAVLQAVKTLPFAMGKTGLIKLLTGSVESRVRADRSSGFGALAELRKGTVDSLLDRLIADGYLFRDLDHEYKLISLTERGANAGAADLAAYDAPADGSSTAAFAGDPDDPLDPVAEATLNRLTTWRRDRAARDAVPPYVIAHNTMLRAIARSRPGTAAALAQVKGLGPARVEKYGAEILALVNDG